ncbi:MAG TPA: nucleotidyltransferase family protein [Puia sp.]|nr:nucleotidyltransferase family protein [Puia sp.]
MNGIIILAAGSSSRLGQPKQMLTYRNKSLIRHVTDEAIASGTGPVLVVLGANATEVAAELEELAVELEEVVAELKDGAVLIRINTGWQEGMASSIRHGLTEMLKAYPGVDTVVLAVCDQPFVSAALFGQLLALQKETGKGIIASAYEGTLGTPALFGKKYFTGLQELQGHEGAKKLLKLHAGDVSSIPFDGGEIDIDTPEDSSLLKNKG